MHYRGVTVRYSDCWDGARIVAGRFYEVDSKGTGVEGFFEDGEIMEWEYFESERAISRYVFSNPEIERRRDRSLDARRVGRPPERRPLLRRPF